MRKPTSPQPTVPFAGRALTAREAAFGRPAVAAPAPIVRRSTLNTARPTKATGPNESDTDKLGRPRIAVGGRGNSSPSPIPSTTAPTRNAADRSVAVRTVAPAAVPKVATDQRVVVGLVLGFLGCAIVLMSVNVTGNMRSEKARTEMTETFRSVHTQQQTFRMLNTRFATWPELLASGATVPASEAVRASKADSSHWFISLGDSRANMICDRTGELWDESPDDRTPVCRKLAQ